MADKQEITQLIFDIIDDLNVELPQDRRLEKLSHTVLFGDSGKLDSLGLVNLIVKAEQRIQDDLGVTMSLADERALTQESSPYATVESFADYISLILSEHEGG